MGYDIDFRGYKIGVWWMCEIFNDWRISVIYDNRFDNFF